MGVLTVFTFRCPSLSRFLICVNTAQECRYTLKRMFVVFYLSSRVCLEFCLFSAVFWIVFQSKNILYFQYTSKLWSICFNIFWYSWVFTGLLLQYHFLSYEEIFILKSSKAKRISPLSKANIWFSKIGGRMEIKAALC